jgi:carbamoyltransferase
MMLIRQRFDNIAAAAQVYLERLLVEWVKNAIKQTGINKIVCAGGIFLNVKANKTIVEMPEVEAAFFYPAAGDDGTTIGSGLQAYHKYCLREGLKPEKIPIQGLYYGPQYSNEQIEHALRQSGWIGRAKYFSEINSVIGNALANGKIIARFNGRLEWGPRALGNRSILGDPRDMKIINRINLAIKHRDFWMPFAPSILESRVTDYLVKAKPSPYMILAFDTTSKRDELSAGIHPWDKTCRPQTVTKEWNPSYWEVIEAFQEKTGVGGILNTSFNLHRYPIVCNPKQAIWAFENSGLDSLAIGNYYVSK